MDSLFEHKAEELTVNVEGKPSDLTFKQLLKKIAELLFDHRTYRKWDQDLETRRHSPLDPGHQHEPDFGQRIRESEGYDPGARIRIDRYDEGGGGKHSWKDYALGILALIIVGWLARIDVKMDKLTEVVVKTDQQGREIAELRCTVYKTCP